MRALLPLAYLAFSPVLSAQIQSAVWSPGTGDDSALVDGSVVVIDTILSTGVIELEAHFAALPTEAKVAYALSWDDLPGGYYGDLLGQRYFTVASERITTNRATGGGVDVEVSIPMTDQPFLHPNSSATQRVFVWIGDDATMTVDPLLGVTGAAYQAEYRIDSELPARTIIPPSVSVQGRIGIPTDYSLTLVRTTPMGTDETYTLSEAGHVSLRQAVQTPSSVTILANENHVTFDVTFDPELTKKWTATDKSLSLTATSPTGTITTDLHFSGEVLSTDPGVIGRGGDPSGTGGGMLAIAVEPRGGFNCMPATIVAQQPSGSGSSDCVANGAPDCGTGLSNGTNYVWYYPYSCPKGEGSCNVSDYNFSASGSTYNEWTKPCETKPSIGEAIFGTAAGAFRPRWGLMCCWSYTPSGGTQNYSVKTCS